MPDLQAESRPAQTATTGSQSQEEAKPSTMPAHDGIRFNDDQGVYPVRPQTAERRPKGSVKPACLFMVEHDELLA